VSFCAFCRAAACSPWVIAMMAKPIALLASSTAPIASNRAWLFASREPSTRPEVPSSPVRV